MNRLESAFVVLLALRPRAILLRFVFGCLTGLWGTAAMAQTCGEASCVPAQGAYISHFTGSNCTGTESYYLPYDGFGYSCRSWDGGGQCGTIQRTVTNVSYKYNGSCYNAWPGGNTLSQFVTVYRGGGGPTSFTLSVSRAGTGSGTVSSSPAGISCGATCSAAFPAGTAVTLSAAAASGSTFAGWSGGGCSGTGSCTVTLSAAQAVTATFNANPTGGGGCGEASCVPAQGAYVSHFTGSSCTGTESYYLPYDNFGYSCRSWDGGGQCGTIQRTVTNVSYKYNGTCYNAWPGGNTLSQFVTVYRGGGTPSFTLSVSRNGTGSGTVSSSPAGINCGAACSASFPSGTAVTLSAVAASGSTFAGWSGGGCSGAGACTLTLSAAQTMTATFNTNPTGGGCGEPSCVPAQGTYISHFTGAGCTGTESYYLPYDGYGYSCRSWDGGGQCGTIRRTVTNVSYRYNGVCYDAWPGGNTLANFVTIYRGQGSGGQKSPATLTVAPEQPATRFRAPERCVAGCFELVRSSATPAYVSRDVPRAVTLVYRSGQAHPMGRVWIDAVDPSQTRASRMGLRLLRPDGSPVTFINGATELSFATGTSGTVRLAGIFDAGALPTGLHGYSAEVRSYWPDGTVLTANTAVEVLVLNESQSPYGAGWTIAGLQKVTRLSNGFLVTDGSGGASVFGGGCPIGGTCSFTSPPGDFSTLAQNGASFVRRWPDGTVLTFGSDGKVRSSCDRFNSCLTFTYDPSTGLLSGITDPVSMSTYFGYDLSVPGRPRLANIVAPGYATSTRVSSYWIDEQGDLRRITDPDFGFTSLSYVAHRLTQSTDRGNGDWTYTYAADGTLASIVSPGVSASGAFRRPTTILAAPGSGFAGAIAGGAGTSQNPIPRTIELRGVVTNPRGHSTFYTINRWGSPTVTQPPIGPASTADYDATTGQLTRTVSPTQHTLVYTWSGPDLTSTTDQTTGTTLNVSYEPTYHQPTRIWGNTVETWMNYHPTTKVLQSVRRGTATAPLTNYTFDAAGRVLTVTDPEGHATVTTYEPGGLQNTRTVTAPGNRRTTYGYDGYGRLTSVIDPASNSTGREYDLLNRVTRTTAPLGANIQYIYDALHLTEVRDARNQIHRYDRNALGWLESYTDPGGRMESYEYDENGNQRFRTNRRGQLVETRYDAMDRPTMTIAGTEITTFDYDPAGRFMTASNAESVDRLEFDVAGRLQQTIISRGTRTYTVESTYSSRFPDLRTNYDIEGPGLPFVNYGHYDFNDFGQPESLRATTTSGFSTNLGFNNDRQATTIQTPTFGTIFRRFPSTHLTGEISYSLASLNAALGETYTHDALSRISDRRAVGSDTRKTYFYDPLGQLTGFLDRKTVPGDCYWDPDQAEVCNGPSDVIVGSDFYTYDAVGNRTDRGSVVEPGNRLRVFDGYNLDYDADGNLIRKYKAAAPAEFDQSLVWDPRGLLQRVETRRNGVLTVVAYGYDAFKRRVRKTTSTSVTSYVYDGDHLVLELDGNGALIAEYFYYPGLDRPHSVLRGSNNYSFVFDATGNVKGLVEGSTLVAQYQYSPFGTVVSSSGPPLAPFRFKGREYDEETGLYYVRARYYDPALTRFISEDPIGLAAGVNPYLFGANDPINHSDPFGLDFWVDGDGCPSGYEVVKKALVNREVDSTLCTAGPGLRSGTNPHPSDRGGVGPLLFHGGIGGGLGIWGQGAYTIGLYVTADGDFGTYRRWELGLGIEKPGFSFELGVSRPGIFDGQSYAACGGFVHGGCVAWNSSGWAPSYEFGIAGGHFAHTETTRNSIPQFIREHFIAPFVRFVTPDPVRRTFMGRPF